MIFAWLLAVSTPEVSLDLQINRVPSVLAELNEHVGTSWKASPEFADTVVGVRVKERTLSELRNGLAVALDGRWDGDELVPDASMHARFLAQYDALLYDQLDATFAALTGGTYRAPRVENSPFKIHDDGVTSPW